MANKELEKEVPPEFMQSYFEGSKTPVAAQAADDDVAAQFEKYFGEPPSEPDEDPEEAVPVLHEVNDAKLDEILTLQNEIVDRLRNVGNILVPIESQLSAFFQNFDEKKRRQGGDTEKLLLDIKNKLDDLDRNGFKAQLSDAFDYLQPETMKGFITEFEKRLKLNYNIAKTYKENLADAIKIATKTAILWAIITGTVGSLLCGAVIYFLLS